MARVLCQEVDPLGDASVRETAQKAEQGTDSGQPGHSLLACTFSSTEFCYPKMPAAAGCAAERRCEPGADDRDGNGT